MNSTSHLVWLSLAVAIALSATAPAADPLKPIVERPQGQYESGWLTLTGGKGGEVKLFVSLRDGKGAAAWFLNSPALGIKGDNGRYLVEEVKLTRQGDAIAGTIAARNVTIWAPMRRVSQDSWTIEAKVASTGIQGTWKVVRGESAENGQLSGAWSTGGGALSDQISALADARPLWRAEHGSLSGWGTGADNRYPLRAAVGGLCGGTSSPVIANGRVFTFHYVPSGNPDPAMQAKAKEFIDKGFPGEFLSIERSAMVDFFRLRADVVVTAMDAATGQTLWRTTFPERTGNYQTHKWRGPNPAPCVIGSLVFVADYSNNYVALRAETGEPVWTFEGPGSKTIPGDRAWSGPFRAGPVVVLQGDSTLGVNPETGAVVWKAAGGKHALPWSQGGVDRVLVLSAGKPGLVLCLDAAKGTELWKQETSLHFMTIPAVTIEDDMLLGFALSPEKQAHPLIRFQGHRLSATGMQKVWEDQPLVMDENPMQAAARGRFYVGGMKSLRCLDAATGKQLAVDDAFQSGSNPWIAFVSGKLIIAPEGQHGRVALLLYDADPANFKPLGPPWAPPSNHTTAYGVHPLAFPVVDGRLFVRGYDGLFCYDLRKANKLQGE